MGTEEEGVAADPLTPESVIVRNPRTAARTVKGKSLIVVIDQNELHTLNEAGSFLWEQCEGKSVSQLAQLLAERYRLDLERARQDVCTFLGALRETGALRVEED